MSNKLKKKSASKPQGYKNRSRQLKQKYEKLSEECFVEVFYSVQFLGFCVLGMEEEDGGFNFSEEQITFFNNSIKENNDTYDSSGKMSYAMEVLIKKQMGFDCNREAKKFPYRAKIKMCGQKLKGMNNYEIAIESTTEAIETYLVLAVQALREKFAFSGEMVNKWWNKCIEISDLYARGMTTEFLIDYLEKEFGLKIER